MSDANTPKPGLQIDDDWKAQARAEKERLAAQAKQASQAAADAGASTGAAAAAQAGGTGQPAGAGQLPKADFKTMVSRMVTEAMMSLGMIPEPQSGRRVAVLDLARFHIDMLSVLEQKTQGNRDDEESRLLATALHELRSQYVQVSQQAIQQQAEQVSPRGSDGKS